MSDKNESFHLVKGQFSPEEAREVLLSLINSKIQFHELQIMRKKARGEGDIDVSLQRIESLEERSRDQILELTSMYDSLGCELELEAEVVLSLVIKKALV